MIQELFTGNSELIGGGESNNITKQSITPSTSPLSSTTSSAVPSKSENPKCPRCDSPNTKFCYYNNYNLTQPRHFCKTCRRYWTKGGALRNVPIGGGCRKNKNNIVGRIVTTTAKSNAAKLKSSILGSMFEPEIPSNNTNFLFHSPQNHNPVFNSLLRGDHFQDGKYLTGMNDSYNQIPNMWKNNSNPQQQNYPLFGEVVQGTGLEELYQRLKTTSTGRSYDHEPSMILESAPVAGGELMSNFWNPTFSTWSDLPTPNSAFLQG